MLSRYASRIPWLAIAVGPALLFAPMLLQREALFWGTPLLQFVPWWQFAIETLRQGYLPLWNPLVGMGAPLLANYQSAILYPPHALLLLTGPAWGGGVLVMFHLMWSGAGMVLLARRLKFGVLGESIAALAYALSGYLVARAGFYSINAAAAWLPWIIWAAERLVELWPGAETWRARWWALFPLAAALAMQWLAGHAQTAWYSLMMLGAWVAWRSFGGRDVRRALGILGGVALAGLLALALAAAQLLPTLEYLSQSYRAVRVDTEFALTYSFWPWRLIGLIAPGLFGSPATGDFWGYGNFWEDAIYVGVLPLALAMAAAIRGWRRRPTDQGLGRVLCIIAAGALLLALGSNTPVFPFLFRWVPTFALFQAPTRWNLLLIFCLALLAGQGATAWRKAEGKGLYWTRLGTAGAVAVTGAAWLARLTMPDLEPTFVRGFSLAGIWLVLCGALALTRRETPSALWISAAIGVVCIDLVVAGYGLNPSAPLDLYQGTTMTGETMGKEHRAFLASDLEQQVKFEWAFRFDTFHALDDWRAVREIGLPNTLMLDRVPSTSNFDPLLPARYVTWMESVNRLGGDQAGSLLSLMDVGWRGMPATGAVLPVRYVPETGASRVRFVGEASAAGSADEALAAVVAPGFDPGRTVVLEGVAPGDLVSGPSAGEAALLPDNDPNRVRVRVRADQAGWVVLSDVWYPGWRVTIDGEPAPNLRADYLFRAVRVESGEHEVEWSYRPASFVAGAIASLTASGLAVLVWLLARRRERPSPNAP